ncbi:MAG: hypothetical protein Q8Q09_22015 [Deltaproteobacteria bacterium]|nr:hypothetical protein [Deltaproteobacteria bacterium]
MTHANTLAATLLALALCHCGVSVAPQDAGPPASAFDEANWPIRDCLTGRPAAGGWQIAPDDPVNCDCLAARPPDIAGICGPADAEYPPHGPTSCVIPGWVTGTVFTNPVGAWGCVPLSYCRAFLARGILRSDPVRYLNCYYPDQTQVMTGVLPATTGCTEALSGVLCGVGPTCAPCAAGDGCWGGSERNSLGICAPRADLRLCSRASDCGSDACIKIADRVGANTLRPDDFGRCVPRERCLRAAAASPGHFRCESN